MSKSLKKKRFALVHDKFRKARGGYSRFLEIFCETCGNFLVLYQKDGPGALKRMYVDRIFFPLKLSKLKNVPVKQLPILTCEKCKQVVGMPILYEKEQRPAFRLFEGSVTKKVKKM